MDAVHTLKFEKKAIIPTDPRTKLFLTVTVSTARLSFCFFQRNGRRLPDLR